MRLYLLYVLIALDQLANALFGGSPDETLSAHAYRSQWKWRTRLINALFFDRNHCKAAWEDERDRMQFPETYRNPSQKA